MSVKTQMTAVAGGIRTLTGKTDALTLDGMSTDLATLKTYVTNALNAVKAKGVTVSSSAKLQNLATLINAIETGGAGDVFELFGHDVYTGTYTPSVSQFSPVTITTTCKPGKTEVQGDIVIMFLDMVPAATNTNAYGWFGGLVLNNARCITTTSAIDNYGVGMYGNDSGSRSLSSDPSKICAISVNSSGYVQLEFYAAASKTGFLAGKRYRWLYIRRGIGE